MAGTIKDSLAENGNIYKHEHIQTNTTNQTKRS
jgi:hypothetical protein